MSIVIIDNLDAYAYISFKARTRPRQVVAWTLLPLKEAVAPVQAKVVKALGSVILENIV